MSCGRRLWVGFDEGCGESIDRELATSSVLEERVGLRRVVASSWDLDRPRKKAGLLGGSWAGAVEEGTVGCCCCMMYCTGSVMDSVYTARPATIVYAF